MSRITLCENEFVWIVLYLMLFVFVATMTYITAKLLDKYIPWIFTIGK